MDLEPIKLCQDQQVGHTPLIDLSGLVKNNGAKLFAKCEYMNPGMSLKDRIASNMINKAIIKRELKPGGTIVCASSGNTGCSVAMFGAKFGFNVIVVTSDKCSLEKLNHIKSYGAKILIVGNDEYMRVADELAEEHGHFNINQYSNPDNPEAYFETLGPEIWSETQGEITHFVMTGSTFGCITGTGRYLKSKNPAVQILLSDPEGSNMYKFFHQAFKRGRLDLDLGAMGNFIIEGAGKSKPTDCLDCNVIDDVVQVTDQESIDMCRHLAKHQGLLVGGSSGLNVHAAVQLANTLTKDNTVVTVLCDSGVKYLSKIYNDNYLQSHNILVSAEDS